MAIENIQIKDFKKVFENPSKKFCFIIGAGASIEAGMPSGNEFAKLLLYEFLKEKDLLGTDLTVTINQLNKFLTDRINFNDLGSSYSAIYSLEKCKEHFYEIFQNKAINSKLTVGYLILSYIVSKEKNKNVIITTNFDDLLMPFLYRFSKLVNYINNENHTANLDTEIPKLIKIHRDIFQNPANNLTEIEKLKNNWFGTVHRLFITEGYVPIFIGYSGIDNGLIKIFESLGKAIPIYWTKLFNENLLPNVKDILDNQETKIIDILGFSDFMIDLFGKHELTTLINSKISKDEGKEIEQQLHYVLFKHDKIEKIRKKRTCLESNRVRSNIYYLNLTKTKSVDYILRNLDKLYERILSEENNFYIINKKAGILLRSFVKNKSKLDDIKIEALIQKVFIFYDRHSFKMDVFSVNQLLTIISSIKKKQLKLKYYEELKKDISKHNIPVSVVTLSGHLNFISLSESIGNLLKFLQEIAPISPDAQLLNEILVKKLRRLNMSTRIELINEVLLKHSNINSQTLGQLLSLANSEDELYDTITLIFNYAEKLHIPLNARIWCYMIDTCKMARINFKDVIREYKLPLTKVYAENEDKYPNLVELMKEFRLTEELLNLEVHQTTVNTFSDNSSEPVSTTVERFQKDIILTGLTVKVDDIIAIANKIILDSSSNDKEYLFLYDLFEKYAPDFFDLLE